MAGSARPSIKVVKTFLYKNVLREWSNRYHFNGGTPADTAHWTTFSDLVVTAEKAVHHTGANPTTIVRTVGLAAGSDVPVFTKTYATVGTLADNAAQNAPGDVAMLGRWSTTARTSKNHPIFLYSYFHGAITNGSGDADSPLVAQRTALTTYGGAWISGFSDGTNTYVRAGPNGATGTGFLAEAKLTHRDFPRG